MAGYRRFGFKQQLAPAKTEEDMHAYISFPRLIEIRNLTGETFKVERFLLLEQIDRDIQLRRAPAMAMASCLERKMRLVASCLSRERTGPPCMAAYIYGHHFESLFCFRAVLAVLPWPEKEAFSGRADPSGLAGCMHGETEMEAAGQKD
jgi:hypothetical protein